MNKPFGLPRAFSRYAPDARCRRFPVKVFLAIALLAVLLSVVLLGIGTQAMATVARSFCTASIAIFACAATVGLASRSKI